MKHVKYCSQLTGIMIAALTIISNGALAQPINVEAAKKEGRVVVYGSVVPQSMEGLHQAFKKKYGIDVDYWRGSSTQVSERALTEWRAGKPGFDVAEGNRGVQLINRDEGLYAKFIPPASEKFPAKFKEKDGMITPWRVLPISILYNTDLVKANEIPKTFDDLLNPKWTGKISIPDPTRQSAREAKADSGGVAGSGHDGNNQGRSVGGDNLYQVRQAI